jgi:hypothetical protein
MSEDSPLRIPILTLIVIFIILPAVLLEPMKSQVIESVAHALPAIIPSTHA